MPRAFERNSAAERGRRVGGRWVRHVPFRSPSNSASGAGATLRPRAFAFCQLRVGRPQGLRVRRVPGSPVRLRGALLRAGGAAGAGATRVAGHSAPPPTLRISPPPPTPHRSATAATPPLPCPGGAITVPCTFCHEFPPFP